MGEARILGSDVVVAPDHWPSAETEVDLDKSHYHTFFACVPPTQLGLSSP